MASTQLSLLDVQAQNRLNAGSFCDEHSIEGYSTVPHEAADEVDVRLFEINGLEWLKKRDLWKVIHRLQKSGYIPENITP